MASLSRQAMMTEFQTVSPDDHPGRSRRPTPGRHPARLPRHWATAARRAAHACVARSGPQGRRPFLRVADAPLVPLGQDRGRSNPSPPPSAASARPGNPACWSPDWRTARRPADPRKRGRTAHGPSQPSPRRQLSPEVSLAWVSLLHSAKSTTKHNPNRRHGQACHRGQTRAQAQRLPSQDQGTPGIMAKPEITSAQDRRDHQQQPRHAGRKPTHERPPRPAGRPALPDGWSADPFRSR